MKDIQSTKTDNKPTIEQSSSPWKHVSSENWNNYHWQQEHSLQGINALQALLGETMQNSGGNESLLKKTVERYRFRVTPYYLSLIDWNDPNDPIRRQCIPDLYEMADEPEYSADPFREEGTVSDCGIVHRFSDRVLLVASSSCAMYCRHCTRKNTLDQMHPTADKDFVPALEYIADHKEVREVLISGGDPLLLNTKTLNDLLEKVQAIEHVEVVRIGTRVPVVLPMRVDDELAEMLGRHKPLWINTQFNHPRELTEEAVAACRKLTDAGIPVSNQSVLLKGINDDFETMRELCTKLQRSLIRPYYVFQCDPIAGISHFRTDITIGGKLEKQLRESIGGLALPRFVADIPGKKGKTPLTA